MIYRISPLQFSNPIWWHHHNIRLGLNGTYVRKLGLAYYENKSMLIMPNTKDKRRRSR